MNAKFFFKNNGTDLMPFYDFVPPKNWGGGRIRAMRQAISKEIEVALLDSAEKVTDEWVQLFLLLPSGLLKIIMVENSEGNFIVSIGKAGWPNPDSIVVNLQDRFQLASRELVETAKWRLLNDPHYCREEISESMCQTEHLLIT